MLQDAVRLELQLENALILAQGDAKLYAEKLSLRKVIQNLSIHWPNVKIETKSDADLLADKRALECILRNLFQNAYVHGEAKNISVTVKDDVKTEIRVSDDGRGFAGDPNALGSVFVRHSTTSGSGVGLYLSKILAKRMKGSLSFNKIPSGFEAVLILPRGNA